MNWRHIYGISCFVVFALLTIFYTALIILWATRALDEHIFSINHIGTVQQYLAILGQIWTVPLLAGCTFAVQGIAADKITRRGKCVLVHLVIGDSDFQGFFIEQSVAALNDNLAAWDGLGASIMALWRSRRLWWRFHSAPQLRNQILLILGFFFSVSMLHITTPSVISVNTRPATAPLILNVTTMPGHFNITRYDLNPDNGEWQIPSDSELSRVFGAIPFIWLQQNNSIAKPPGVNETFVDYLLVIHNGTADRLHFFVEPYTAP